MRVLTDIAYGENPNQTLDIYLPSNDISCAFLYFHGGELEREYPPMRFIVSDNDIRLYSRRYGVSQSFYERSYHSYEN